MNEWTDRDYGDEDDFEGFLDEDEDDDINLGGALVPNNPYPSGPSRGDTIEVEKELVLI